MSKDIDNSVEFLNRDLKTLNSIVSNLNIETLNIYKDDNGKLKDTLKEKQINTIVKTILLDMENKNEYNFFTTHGLLDIKCLENDVIQYMLENKDIMEKQGIYVILHQSSSDQQKIDYISSKDEKSNCEMIIKRIKDLDFLKSIVNSERTDFLNGLVSNPFKSYEITNSLMNRFLNDLDFKLDTVNYYFRTNSLHNLINDTNNKIDFKHYERILNNDNVNTSFLTDIAKNENITSEMVEKIMNINDEEKGSNPMFARTELILNQNVEEKYKIEIIENKDKYPFYNSNTDDIVEMYQNALNKEFNKTI